MTHICPLIYREQSVVCCHSLLQTFLTFLSLSTVADLERFWKAVNDVIGLQILLGVSQIGALISRNLRRRTEVTHICPPH